MNRQRQTFAYDALERLVSSMPNLMSGTVSAIGEYTETYAYDTLGNITSKAGVTYGELVKKVKPRGTTAYVGDYEVAWLVPTQTTSVPVTFTRRLYLPVVAGGRPLAAGEAVTTTYYRFNGVRVAMREGSTVPVAWLHGIS